VIRAAMHVDESKAPHRSRLPDAVTSDRPSGKIGNAAVGRGALCPSPLVGLVRAVYMW